MIDRTAVTQAFELMLGRPPANEQEIADCLAVSDRGSLGLRLLGLPEFQYRFYSSVAPNIDGKWVCTEIPFGLRLWINLADIGMAAWILNGRFEPSETALLQHILKPGDIFVDIGANIGWFTLLAARAVGETGHVHAFEPNPRMHARLAQSIRENNFEQRCTIHPVALGAASSTLDLFHIPGERNEAHAFIASEALQQGAVSLGQVEVKPLDDFQIEGRVRMLKVDVEGAEPLVFDGARAFIERHRPVILCEIFPTWIRRVSRCQPDAVLRRLQDFGYRAFHLTEGGIGREILTIQPGDDDFRTYFNIVALSADDCAIFLDTRLDSRVQDLQAQLASDAAQSAETMRQLSATGAETLRAAEAETGRIARELEAMRARAADAEAVAAAAAAETRRLSGELEGMRDRAAAGEAAAHRAEQTRLASQTVAAERDLAQREAAALKASTSWRVTAPLRGLAGLLRGTARSGSSS